MSRAAHPVVDVVIAAHDPARAVGRAVASALDGAADAVRVTVVAHGRDEDEFADHPGMTDHRVRIVPFHDGIASPAGPFNHGLAMADSRYVCLLGSDDFLEPSAIPQWLAYADRHRVDYLIPVLRNQDGARWRDPLTRAGRHARLDLLRDRLSYRAAPLGLIRRTVLPVDSPPLTEGLATGEDIELGLRLVCGGGRIDVGIGLPAYVIGADAPQRVTLERRALSEELRALRRLSSVPWLTGLPPRRRHAIAVKLWRMNLVPAVLARADDAWSEDDLNALSDVACWLEKWAPHSRSSLSIAEDRIARQTLAPHPVALRDAIDSVRRASQGERMRTANPLRALGTDSPLRRMIRLRMPA